MTSGIFFETVRIAVVFLCGQPYRCDFGFIRRTIRLFIVSVARKKGITPLFEPGRRVSSAAEFR